MPSYTFTFTRPDKAPAVRTVECATRDDLLDKIGEAWGWAGCATGRKVTVRGRGLSETLCCQALIDSIEDNPWNALLLAFGEPARYPLGRWAE